MDHPVLCETTSMYYVWGWHGSRLVPHTDSVTWSIEAKHSFMTLDSAALSDRLVLADDLYIVQQRYDFCRICT